MRPLLHVASSEPISDYVKDALVEKLGEDYNIVFTNDLVSLYIQDPEALQQIVERLDYIVAEIEHLKRFLAKGLYVAGIGGE